LKSKADIVQASVRNIGPIINLYAYFKFLF
jgi:hypothetical protein